jgi:uncharacterized protein (TIGR02147 family)
MVFEFSTYRDLLKGLLAERIRQNPRYSLRGFARHLGVQPSLLSEVMGGRRRLTAETAAKIADRLEFEDDEREYFELLVQLDRAKTVELREATLKRIAKIRPDASQVHDLGVDLFRTIADWYHLPLLRLLTIKSFDWTNRAAAKALGIPEVEVDAALRRMERLELLRILPSGKPERLSPDILVESKVPNDSLKKYNLQMLEKAAQAVTRFSPRERFTGTENFALDADQFERASQILEDCFTKILALSSESRGINSEVFHLGIHLFRLTELSQSRNPVNERTKP